MADDATVTTSTRTHEASDLKKRLSSVQDQLQTIESQVRQDAESLQKLRQMLDVSYLEEITGLIADLELRVNEVASDAEEARRRADEAEETLRSEQERLEKLWDVYKVQETDLENLRGEQARHKATAEAAEERARELEAQVEAERRALRQAQAETGDLRQKLADAEARAEDLKSYEALGTKVTELEENLNDERERLAKLYAVYEETQAERDDANARLKQWQAWWDAHHKSLKGVTKAVNEAPVE